MARPMTPEEKVRWKRIFPKLDVDRALVTGEATPVYNCISWTVGITDRWIWPGGTLRDFDDFYGAFGYRRSMNGPIAAWSIGKSMTHGCVSGPSHGPRWESKCGQLARIQHGLRELEGSAYGQVLAFYDNSASASAEPAFEALASGVNVEVSVELQSEQRELLDAAIEQVRQSVADEFERKFSLWKSTWGASETALFSNPAFVTTNQEFRELVAMGADVIPLVVAKLTEAENFFALQLYDAIQPDVGATVRVESIDESIVDGEQGRARRTVQRWIANQ